MKLVTLSLPSVVVELVNPLPTDIVYVFGYLTITIPEPPAPLPVRAPPPPPPVLTVAPPAAGLSPATCSLYGDENNLLEKPGWKRFKRLAKRKKKILRILNQDKLRSHRKSPRCEF